MVRLRLPRLALGAVLALLGGGSAASAQTFANPTPILIGGSGLADPCPSRISVSGVGASLTELTVTLHAVGHTFPDDLDIALVGPTGAAIVLQSDCGGSKAMGGVTYTLSDTATSPLPDASGITPGSYRPSECEAVNEFAALHVNLPGPPPGSSTTLGSVFGGTDPNGAWSLYVIDDSPGDSGIIQGGWSITISSTPVELQRFTVD